MMSSQRRLQVTAAHLTPQPTAAQINVAEVPVSNTYQYTVDNHLLTKEQRDFYEENGFFVVRKQLPVELLEVFRQRFIKLCNKEVKDVSPFLTFMRDVSIAKTIGKQQAIGESIIAKVQDFEDDEVLFEYCKHPEIVKYVQCFVGPDVKSVHTMVINKPPYAGATGVHPLHQDLHYFPFRPADRIVASWTAIDKCTKENGCLVVLPGTHKGELLDHGYPEYGVNAAFHEIKGAKAYDTVPRVYLEMEPGDTVYFHPKLIHGSGPNTTKGFRKSISCHYASSNCFFVDVTGTSTETMAKEFAELSKKLAPGIEVSYSDFWRFKSRLVAGKEGTLS